MASSVVCVSGDVTSLSGSLLELIEKDANNSVPGFRSLTISHQIFPSVIKKKNKKLIMIFNKRYKVELFRLLQAVKNQ